MPVRKYHSVTDQDDTGSLDPASPNLGRIIADLWAFNERLVPAVPLRGVRKFKTMDELNRHRWETQLQRPRR